MTKQEFQYVLNIRLKVEETVYNPRGPAPCPAATMVETQTPKVFSTRPQGPVLVNDCFLIYPFQLETNRREYVPLSKPVGAPFLSASNFPTSQALSRTCLPVLLPLLWVPLVSAECKRCWLAPCNANSSCSMHLLIGIFKYS